MVVHDQEHHVFQVDFGDHHWGRVEYELESKTALIVSVFVEIPGQGYGSRLMEEVLPEIEKLRWKIIPVCPYARAYLRRHPDWWHLIGLA